MNSEQLREIEERRKVFMGGGFLVADRETCDEDGSTCLTGKVNWIANESQPEDYDSGPVEVANFAASEDAERFVQLMEDLGQLIVALAPVVIGQE